MGFRSGLEEKVADLLVQLDVDYEYEETSYPYVIEHSYTPDFVLPVSYTHLTLPTICSV